MPLEFSHEGLVLRVDGDLLEIFNRGDFSHRVPLAWLAVQVQPSIKGSLVVRIASARDDRPLYEVMQKAKDSPVLLPVVAITPGTAVELVIRTEEEPYYRQFFTQVAQLCGRPVVP
jgi:hypothetical protein